MKQILDKLKDSVLVCDTRIKKVNAERELNQANAAKLDKKKKDLDAREKVIKAETSRLEDLKVKHEDLAHAGQLKKELSLELKRQKKITESIEAGKKDVLRMEEDAMAKIKARTEKLNKATLQLDEDKKSYKDKIMASLAKDLEKKGISL